MTSEVYNLSIQTGIQRDGTLFDAPCYVDGKWVRFQRGRPRKIWGYKGVFLNAPGITRGMVMQSQTGENYLYAGYSDSLQYWQTDDDDGVAGTSHQSPSPSRSPRSAGSWLLTLSSCATSTAGTTGWAAAAAAVGCATGAAPDVLDAVAAGAAS